MRLYTRLTSIITQEYLQLKTAKGTNNEIYRSKQLPLNRPEAVIECR